MILELHIEHVAIIDRLDITFQRGLNVLTGETGAGKSIIINALNLILGDRASDDLIRSQEDQGVVEALFDISHNAAVKTQLQELDMAADDTLLIRRVLSRNDRSRIYINGQLATLQMAGGIGEFLLNIYGQHQHQMLRRPETHLDILDEFGGLLTERSTVQSVYQTLNDLDSRLKALREQSERVEHDRDLWTFQVSEIDAAKLAPEEEDELTAERHLLKNAQRLLDLIGSCESILHSGDNAVIEQLGRAEEEMTALAELDQEFSRVKTLIQSAQVQVQDVAHELTRRLGKMNTDPGRLEEVELRLDEIHRLKRKYKVPDVTELLAHRDRIHESLRQIGNATDEITRLEGRRRELLHDLTRAAANLSEGRQKAAQRLVKEVEKELHTLKMARTTFEVQTRPPAAKGDRIETDEGLITSRGREEIEFMIAPNVGEDPKPLSRIASGGELSRIMLAIKKILTMGIGTQTLVFDEVDAGIGGTAANVVGQKLRDLARYHQILCVTHLPQIAAFGHAHYRVTKAESDDRTVSSIQRLEGEEVLDEIARMLAGAGATLTTRTQAQEMLQHARREYS